MVGQKSINPQESGPHWRVVAASVRGAAHVRTALPNQDAVGWLPDLAQGPPLVVVVSDGHGSARCFRSDRGSNIAVRTATQMLGELLASRLESASPSAVKREVEERLLRQLVRTWREDVEKDLAATPISTEELDLLESRDGSAARASVEADPVIAYGATMLGIAVADSFIVYLQLGDGDILVVDNNGQVDRPVAGDQRLFANATTSLCGDCAWRDIRVTFQALAGSPPALILMSSDGYANSFRDDAAFLKIGPDLLETIRNEGIGYVKENLESWLNEASQSGSGDDITLAILCRHDASTADGPPSIGE